MSPNVRPQTTADPANSAVQVAAQAMDAQRAKPPDVLPKPVRFAYRSGSMQHDRSAPRGLREVVFAILTRDKQVISKTGLRRSPAISCYPCDRPQRNLCSEGSSDVDDDADCDRITHLRGESRSRLAFNDRRRGIMHHLDRGEASAVLQMRALHARALRRALSGAIPGYRNRGSRRPRLRSE